MTSVYQTARKGLLLCAVAGMMTAASLSVSHAATRQQQSDACKGDALKFCTFDIPNEKKIAACLAAKRDKLTPACQAFFPADKGQKKTKKSK